MFRRIALTTLITLFCLALAGGYFFHVGRYAGHKKTSGLCREVHVTVLDSLESCIADREEISLVVGNIAKGCRVDSIDIYCLERIIRDKGEIMDAQVYHDNGGAIIVEVTQRKPVVRLENGTDGFYSDLSGFIFPVTHHIDVPVVTGHIKVNAGSGFKGYADSSSTEWIKGVAELAERISSDRYWNRQVEQIDVEKNGDIVLYTSTGNEKIIFGDCSDLEAKFAKLEAYYTNIEPHRQDKEYETVNLKFKNQIICK